MKVYIVMWGVHYEGSSVVDVFGDLNTANEFLVEDFKAKINYTCRWSEDMNPEDGIIFETQDDGTMVGSYRDQHYSILTMDVR